MYIYRYRYMIYTCGPQRPVIVIVIVIVIVRVMVTVTVTAIVLVIVIVIIGSRGSRRQRRAPSRRPPGKPAGRGRARDLRSCSCLFMAVSFDMVHLTF